MESRVTNEGEEEKRGIIRLNMTALILNETR